MFLLGVASCQSQSDKEIAYLSIDSVYKSAKEIKIYKKLKREFLKVWFDSTNCYMKQYFKKPMYSWESVDDVRKILRVQVDNIIHTQNYDSVIVFVTYYAARIKNNKQDSEISCSDAMKAIIYPDGKWYFNCKQNNLGADMPGDDFETTTMILKTMIISSGYLVNGKPDPQYIHNFFIKPVTFPKSTEREVPAMGPVK